LPLSKGSFQETLSEPKDSVDTVVQKLNLSQTHLYELKNWKKIWSCQPASIDNISDFHLFTILPPQHTEILIPNCQPTCLDDGRRDVQQVLYEGYRTSESNAQIRRMNAILPALLKFWTLYSRKCNLVYLIYFEGRNLQLCILEWHHQF